MVSYPGINRMDVGEGGAGGRESPQFAVSLLVYTSGSAAA